MVTYAQLKADSEYLKQRGPTSYDLTRFLGGFLDATMEPRMVTVCQFGARGDGVSDDTAAIQQALDSGAAVVKFPAGEYLITHPLQGISGIKILGAGKYISTIHSQKPMNLIECMGLTDFSDFEVAYLGFSGIRSDLNSRGLSFAPLGSAGEDAYHHISVHDCYFHDISLGFVFNNQNTDGNPEVWQISDIEIYNCVALRVRAGLGVLNVQRGSVLNCAINDSNYDGIDLLNSSDIVISGLRANNCAEYGVLIRDRLSNNTARPTRSVVVANCVFERCASGVLVAYETGGGGVQDITVDNCIHRDSILNGFTVSGSLTENVAMSNCVARNTKNRGFYVVDTKDTTLSNCRSYNAGIADLDQAGQPVNLRQLNFQSDEVKA